MMTERIARRALIIVALLGLVIGTGAYFAGYPQLARWVWGAATMPVVIALAVSITRNLLQKRMGVDLVAFLAMTAALALGQALAAIVVAIMYAGGTALEDFAVARAERNLKSLVDRAPRTAHRQLGQAIEDVPVEEINVGDVLLVRAGEVIPVDGLIASSVAVIDESALTGEPIPVTRQAGEEVRSGTLNAGQTFSIRALATAGESTYAGILRLVSAAQTAKAPFIRLADRFALLLLPITLAVGSGEPPLRLYVVSARSGLSEGKCHDQENRQCPGKVARTTSRLGFCGPPGAPINRIFVGPTCCESRTSRALGISIGASKGSSARQCELVSSASKDDLSEALASAGASHKDAPTAA